MSKRTFKDLPEPIKKSLLLRFLHLALSEPKEFRKNVNVYTIATQYGTSYGITKKDFNLIKGMTIDELVNNINS